MESKFKQAEARFHDAVRSELVADILSLPEGWQRTFRLMYGRNGGKRSVADAEALTAEAVEAEIPAEKLDWAVQQGENSHNKIARMTANVQAQGAAGGIIAGGSPGAPG